MVSLVVAAVLVAISGTPQEQEQKVAPTAIIELAAPGQYQQLKLKDGTSASGRVESIGQGRFAFRTSTDAVLDVEIANVAELTTIAGKLVNGEFWPADPNPTRLFFTPTGRSLEKGEVYFGVYEILLPFVQVGITDRLSIGGGTPLAWFGEGGQPFWVTPKLQIAKRRSTQVSVGVLHFFNMGDANAGIGYAALTQGNTDDAVTIGAGYAYASANDEREGQPVLMVGAEKRLSKRLKFVTENYWFGNIGLVSGGLRFLGEHLSADVGLFSPIAENEGFILFPMINFVRKF